MCNRNYQYHKQIRYGKILKIPSQAVSSLPLTINVDTYRDYTVCRYSNDKKFGESGSINYCLCTILASCTVMYSFMVKRYVYTSLAKKRCP